MNRPADARLANLLGALATGLTDRMQEVAWQVARLDSSSAAALIALLDFSPAGPIQTLSQICGLTHSGGVRLVNRLAVAGYVERSSGRDARSITVGLTHTGQAAALELRAARHAAIAATMADLTTSQRQNLATACDALIAALTTHRLAIRADGRMPAGGALCRLCDFAACERADGNCPAARTAQNESGPAE